jgi:hypothetical protein
MTKLICIKYAFFANFSDAKRDGSKRFASEAGNEIAKKHKPAL